MQKAQRVDWAFNAITSLGLFLTSIGREKPTYDP